jgi:alkylation response protein AidB-like acyl-CoA dehydrogenase
MEFALTEEQRVLRDDIISFSKKELNDNCSEDDKACVFPRTKWEKCTGKGLTSLTLPEQYGGLGQDPLTTVISMQALAYACKDSGLVHALATHSLCGIQINLFGNDAQKKKYLPKICEGQWIGAQAITEADSGSDALSMKTRAEKRENNYVINGTKIFISNGPICNFALVFTVTDPESKSLGSISCFIVDKGTAGFEQCQSLEKLGLRTLQSGELVFEDCSVPADALLGKKGQGAIIFAEGMEWERVVLFATHLGVMERVLETTRDYARIRQQFGQPIGKFQSVGNKIADMKVNLELGKLILYKAAWLKGAGKRAPLEASIAKLFISESLKQTCLDAVQIHGGYGYSTEFDLERDLRDSIASSIYSGTSEIQRNIIAKLLGC